MSERAIIPMAVRLRGSSRCPDPPWTCAGAPLYLRYAARPRRGIGAAPCARPLDWGHVASASPPPPRRTGFAAGGDEIATSASRAVPIFTVLACASERVPRERLAELLWRR